MTNPDNKLGVNAAFMGRTAPNTFNAELQSWTGRGIVSGFEVTPVSGMTVSIGAADGVPDVAIVEDDIGNRLIMNNRTTVAIEQTLSDAPDTNSRIDAIVIYTNNPPEVLEQIPTVDNPTVCAMLVVEGEAAVTPVAPDDTAIRTAITADGASGTTAYYTVLAYVTVENGVTDITSVDIEAGPGSYPNPELQAGSNVQISGRTISATDTTYTASTGLTLTGTAFSADTTVLATQVNLNAKAVGTTESYTIADTDWTEASGVSPFTYSTTISSTYTIGTNTLVELINDQAVLFANYGFAIGSVSGSSGNLADNDSIVLGTYSIDGNGEVTGVSASTNRAVFPLSSAVLVEPNTTYSISVSGGYRVGVRQTNSSNVTTANRGWSSQNETFSLTTEATTSKMFIVISKPDDSTLDLNDIKTNVHIQVEKGAATPYTPYTGDGHSVTLYALDTPVSSVTLKINYKEVA